ncbi:MAG TPA: NAD(+) kinase [Gammaproteobacteria bacterium]|nr:NAD(+) kinase [Gammaproteobacteria bacterium]
MRTAFKKVILFGKRHREKSTISTLLELSAYLQTIGIQVSIEEETAKMADINDLPIVTEKNLDQSELIIVVGGDGSLLNAARIASEKNIPVLGINRGRLGFLTDIKPDQFSDIEHILKGHYLDEKRFLLNADVISNGKTIHHQTALNDIVLLPGDVAHMIEFSIEIDGQLMCTQRADGLIVATPTGSTAYALSGGGPILHPQLDAVVLVPMFPHKLTSRPIVIAGHSDIRISIDKNNETAPRVSADGENYISLDADQVVHISKNKNPLTLIHPEHYQYFSTLRTKLQWENKPY